MLTLRSAVTEGRGLHSTKDVSLPRIVDASESGSRASQYLPSWKRAGRHAAVVSSLRAASRGKKSHDNQVDFVAAGSRFKVYMPKENTKITFVLAGKSFQGLGMGRNDETDVSQGIRAPRTARSANEKSEPFGAESHRFASRYMQRDVEIGQYHEIGRTDYRAETDVAQRLTAPTSRVASSVRCMRTA